MWLKDSGYCRPSSLGTLIGALLNTQFIAAHSPQRSEARSKRTELGSARIRQHGEAGPDQVLHRRGGPSHACPGRESSQRPGLQVCEDRWRGRGRRTQPNRLLGTGHGSDRHLDCPAGPAQTPRHVPLPPAARAPPVRPLTAAADGAAPSLSLVGVRQVRRRPVAAPPVQWGLQDLGRSGPVESCSPLKSSSCPRLSSTPAPS